MCFAMPALSNRHNIQAVMHSGAGMKISMEGGRVFPLGPSASRAASFISWAPGALPLQLAGRPVLIKGFGRPRVALVERRRDDPRAAL